MANKKRLSHFMSAQKKNSGERERGKEREVKSIAKFNVTVLFIISEKEEVT